MGLLLACIVAAAWLGGAGRRRAEAALRQSEQKLREARNELDTKVAERTAALRYSEERYALATAASEEGFWDWVVATDDVYVSPRLLEIYGFPPGTTFAGRDDFISRFPLHPEDRLTWQESVAAHFAGQTARFEKELRTLRGGETRWLQLTGLATRNASGEVVRWAGATKDITVRKHAEQALRLSEERYARAMEGSAAGHWDWNLASDEMFLSERAQDLLCLGGRVRAQTLGTVDHWAVAMLETVVLDLAFMGANGITLQHGMTVPDGAVAAVKTMAVRVSRRRIFVGDSSKFGSDSFVRFAEVTDFERIVTDSGLPVEFAKQLHGRGVDVSRV